MRALIYIFSLVCAGTMLAQPNWDFDITDKSHNILIPSDLEGISLEQGDYVGVFYEQNGELLCAGHSEYTEGNFVLTAFGASFSYPGFQVGQTFHFMHWSGATETQSEFFVVFNSIDFPNGAHFVVDGMSGISSVAQNPILGCLDSQAVNYNPLASLDDGSCISMFESMYNQSIDSIQGLHVYYTAYSDSLQNLLNLLSDTGSTGNNLLYIDLLQGWNIIGYSLNFETSATEAFSSVVNQLEIVKNNAADVYWVQFDFNGIGNLIPGQGYQVRMNEAVDNFYFE